MNGSAPIGPARRYGAVEVVAQSPAERAARGKAARTEVPRSSHAVYEPAVYRPDPVGLLESQANSRVAELLPIRYGRMLASPLAFYRGAALIMASDLAATPRSGFHVQCCGDAHLSNFGVFASPERRLVFDVNDFDETLPGPWEWDVKRLATSIVIAARTNGFTVRQQQAAVLAAVAEYRERMNELAAMRNLDVWYLRADIENLVAASTEVTESMRSRTEAALAKARTRDSLQAYAKLTGTDEGEPRIVSEPPLIVPIGELLDGVDRDELFDALRAVVRQYRQTLLHDRRVLLEQYRLVDLARKVVGVGSVGTRAWIALLLGRDGRDPLFLQIKEAQASVLEAFVQPSVYRNAGERVVAGQRVMQAVSDIFLGWTTVKEDATIGGQPVDYYLRQLRDWKGSAEPERMIPAELTVYGRVCAATLARAHARSGDRFAIAGYLGQSTTFDQAILAFSETYAEQNDRDYAELGHAVESGRLTAQTDL